MEVHLPCGGSIAINAGAGSEGGGVAISGGNGDVGSCGYVTVSTGSTSYIATAATDFSKATFATSASPGATGVVHISSGSSSGSVTGSIEITR